MYFDASSIWFLPRPFSFSWSKEARKAERASSSGHPLGKGALEWVSPFHFVGSGLSSAPTPLLRECASLGGLWRMRLRVSSSLALGSPRKGSTFRSGGPRGWEGSQVRARCEAAVRSCLPLRSGENVLVRTHSPLLERPYGSSCQTWLTVH